MAESALDTVELAGAGLRLRPYRAEDAAALYAAVRESIDVVGRWLPWCHAGYSMDDAATWISRCADGWRTGEHFAFAVFDSRSDEFIGAAGSNQRNRPHNFMNLGYWVRASRQRRGVAVRASALVGAFGFRQVGLTRIDILVEVDNVASRRVAEVMGASFEAIARNRLQARGKATDAAVYSLTPSDFDADPAPGT
jgi:RimJ/RimL family protein N-acetyltransferase